jgi:DNA-binding CsgD family transcriptional regulator
MTFAEPGGRRTAGSAPAPGQLGEALAGWVEHERRARMLVDDMLRVLWMSSSAERMMSGPNSLLIRNGHIRTRENRFDQQVRELISNAGSQLSTCCLYDAKTGEHLVLTAVRLSAPSDDMVGLTLLRASEDFPFHLADLHSAFGFTQTESRVAYRLMGGRTAGETADELGVSLETVRTHIKRAYAKLGVSSREGFFHRLTPFVIPLA